MRSSANKRSRLASRSRSMRSSTAAKVSDVVMASPSHHAAERAAHHGLADVAGGLAAGRFGQFGGDLGGDASNDGARHIAGDLLRGRQRRTTRPADTEHVAEALTNFMHEAAGRRR